MSTNNILFALTGISALALAYHSLNKDDDIIENFGMLPPRSARTERVVQQGPQKGNFIEVPGTYQAALPPRASAMVDYGAFIRYDMPDVGKRGDSMGSLNYASMGGGQEKKENFCGACTMESFSPQTSGGSGVITDALPLQSSGFSVNALGETDQPIIYDRFIYANQKNPLYALGDPIRGDLPIVPLQKGWFSPASQPQTMLRDSALMVMGGSDLETTKELAALKSASTGGKLSALNSMSIQKHSAVSAAGGDIRVTAFP